jgi:hypothetical protein
MRVFHILFLLLPFTLSAQTKKPVKYISTTSTEAGINLASNGSMTATTIHVERYYGLGKKKKKFSIGFGARLTSSFGSGSLEYITAPAKITSGETGPGVFFASNIPENIDTLILDGTQVNSINAYVLLNYKFHKKWRAEFNIDLAGLSIGGRKNGILYYGESTPAAKFTTTAQPTTGNLLLISDNDLGSLNSELKVFYSLKKRVSVSAGFTFLFNEYTIDNRVNYTNSLGNNIAVDRFRNKSLLFGLGVNITL